ncbi:MAG TPA: N-acetylmuramoyl-L-alanine amidase [Thermoanaerobaculia bacterium]|nr:N-acetylmuramoyl-L-alanine amidase [Thermoanaerobaculia bacterium]
MKRLLLSAIIAASAVTSILLAQTAGQATLRTPAGDKPVQTASQGGHTYFSLIDAISALGGSVTPDSNGFKIVYNKVSAALGPDSRFAVVGDDLIEMPVAPVIIDGKPFVTSNFFDGLLRKASGLETAWDPGAQLLQVRPQQKDTVSVQLSVANVQGISRIVITLSAPAEYAIIKETGALSFRFRAPIRPPFTEHAYDDPHVAKATFIGSDLRIQLTAPDIVGDAYNLQNPFRIVLDLRKGAPLAPGTPPAPSAPRPVDAPGIRTIVIDPGHGGKEVGAIGPNGLMEKDANLALCRKLAAALSAKLGTRTVLTREDDSVVSLDQRSAIANQYKADLFLSVHMNAAVMQGAHGSETYFLSLQASDELARKAAEAENAASAQSGPSPDSDLKLILWDLAQQQYLQESSRFAQTIQEEMNGATGVQSRGVKQAPFKVLVGATMPAALVEVAFITNPEEETKLRNDEFVNRVVEAITNAVRRYKTEYETRIGIAQPQPAKAASPSAPAEPVTSTAEKRSGT